MIAIALTALTFVRERQAEHDVFFSRVDQALGNTSKRVGEVLYALRSNTSGNVMASDSSRPCRLAEDLYGRYPFVVALLDPETPTGRSRRDMDETPCEDTAGEITHAAETTIWIRPGGSLAARLPPASAELTERIKQLAQQRGAETDIAAVDVPELGPNRRLLALIARAPATAPGAPVTTKTALVDTAELMKDAMRSVPGAKRPDAIVTDWRAYSGHTAPVTLPPVWCLFTCTTYSAIRDVNLGSARWHLEISELAPPLSQRYAGSITVAVLGLVLSLLWLLHIRHAQSAAWQVAVMIERRESEMLSLNAILIEDIERRKRTLDELTRSRAQLRQLTEHNARIKEEERTRIAREIHDDLGQSMLALRIDLSLIAEKETNRTKHARIQQALSQIDQTVTAMRLIINELRPAVLDLGLDAAIEWESRKFSRRSGVPCALDLQLGERILRDELTTAYYRIAQESLTNIMRHSQAKSTSVRLWIDEEWLFMKISDDGIGMQDDACPRSGSYGLIGIAERVFALDGAFHLDSAPNKGTQMLVAAPLIRTGGQARTDQPGSRTLPGTAKS